MAFPHTFDGCILHLTAVEVRLTALGVKVRLTALGVKVRLTAVGVKVRLTGAGVMVRLTDTELLSYYNHQIYQTEKIC